MSGFFIQIFRYFKNKSWMAFILAAFILSFTVYFTLKIRFSEDISQLSQGNDDSEYALVLKNLRFSDKMFIHLCLTDTNKVDPDVLTTLADELIDSLNSKLYPQYIGSVTKELPQELMAKLYQIYYQNMPFYMITDDYKRLDSILTPEGVKTTLSNNYRSLISPAGMVFKKYITADPFSITGNSLKRLRSFQLNDNFEIYNGNVITKDRKHLLLIFSTSLPPSETSGNAILIDSLDNIINVLTQKQKSNTQISIEYFGAAAVAVANAAQVKKDILITISIALMIILLFVGWFFRSAIIPIISFLPGIFGGSSALTLIYLIKGNISAISLGIGSVILGIIVDYAIYMFNLYRIKKDSEIVIRDLAMSILLCSFSSAAAFFSLLFVQSKVLQDLGLFAGLSVIMASVYTVVFLPLLLKATSNKKSSMRFTWVDKISSIQFHKSRVLFFGILILALISYFLSSRVSFENNMNNMSFLPPDLAKAEDHLNKTTGAEFRPVYLVATGKSLQEALELSEKQIPVLNNLKKKGVIENYSGVDQLIISDSFRQMKLAEWEKYWTTDKKQILKKNLGDNPKMFKAGAFDEFYTLIDRNFRAEHILLNDDIKKAFLADRIIEKPGFSMVVSILRIDPLHREELFNTFKNTENILAIDRQMITDRMVISVKDDFHLLINLCMLLVSAVLIFAYGRIELGIIASVPMFLSWYLTLGMIYLLGLKLNIINIIVCTFVFGLGVDYTVLMMRGLLHEYKTGEKDMSAYKNAIFISAFTTFIGVGVLIFARHPALSSIAMVSMIGILIVVIVTYTTVPVMFRWLIYKNQNKRPVPVTFFRLVRSVFSYTFYFIFSISVLFFALLLKLIPLNTYKRKVLVRKLNYYSSRMTIFFMLMLRKKIINLPADLKKNPAIIIANHQSLIDIPLALMVGPKIILVPSERVWNSKFTGWLAKLAGFYPTNIGYDVLIERYRDEIAHGNSIIFFPEGTRTNTNSTKRFHKGAFFIAEQLQTDILPMVILGSSHYVPKGEWVGNTSTITIKFLPRINPNDISFGTTYQEKAKSIQKLFQTELNNMLNDYRVPSYHKQKLILNYIYKGPVLEWYLRVKLKLDRNYELFNRYSVPEGHITDIGCGYGFISYMLYFISDKRRITGIDLDADKVEVANNCISKNNNLQFICADIVSYQFEKADTFILCDVLHYITFEQQKQLIHKCINNLNPGGSILIRDGDASLETKHNRTKFTEFFSTHTGFNKAEYKDLVFLNRNMLKEIALQNGLDFEIIENKKFTSNVLFILKRGEL